MAIEEIFLAVVEKAPAKRAAFLDAACAGDAALRSQVEALLRSHEQAGSLLEQPLFRAAPTVDEPTRAEQGGVIGPYKLVQPLGEGGMGTVWMAQQTEPVKRLVALKVIKPGMDSQQVLARFEAERQALALMDHPNIARVLDAGTIADRRLQIADLKSEISNLKSEIAVGRPYFVMELVKGVPITTYCDEHRLTPRQRLELFVPVCQAIQHAHQKGVIHRDIKPSNVLVALYDGKPVPKVIDFGIAKATGPQLTAHTLVTGFGSIVGTLEYMSPEQAELNQLDIDTRSDIYSLGVLLYELLTGSTPLEKKRLKEAAMLEVLRLIREEEPPRPSTRLSASGETLSTISAQRQTEPSKLTRLVRGELDWIVMKALEKDRSRRYETANGFAMDIQHYLADEEVQACPPSAWYRFRKFARRNKTALAVAGLVLFFIVLLGVGGGWVLRDRAARRTVLEQAVMRAIDQTETASQRDRLPEASAALKRAEELLAGGECSEELRERVRQWRADLNLVTRLREARMLGLEVNLAGSCFSPELALPEYEAAFRDYGLDLAAVTTEEAAKRIRSRPQEIQVAVVAALDHWIEWASGNKSKDGNERGQLQAIVRAVDTDSWRLNMRAAFASGNLQKLVDLAAAPDLVQQPAYTQLRLGKLLCANGRLDEGLGVLRRGQQLHPGDYWIHSSLWEYLYQAAPPRHGEKYPSGRTWRNVSVGSAPPGFEEAVRCAWICVALQPDNAGARLNLGVALQRQGKLDEAIVQYREAIRIKRDYPVAHHNLGNVLLVKKQNDAAIAEYKEAIRLDPKSAAPHHGLGNVLLDKKQYDAAIAEYKEAIRLDPKFAMPHNGLGNVLRDKKHYDAAIAECKEAIRLDPNFAMPHYNLGNVLSDKEQYDAAIAEFKEAIRLDPNYALPHNGLGRVLHYKRQYDAAIAEYKEAIRLDPNDAAQHHGLGLTLYRKGRLDEAIAEYKEALRLNKDDSKTHTNLGGALEDKGQLDEAIAEHREAIRLDRDNNEAHINLGAVLVKKGARDEAIAEFREAIRIQKDDFAPHYNLGLVLIDRGRPDEAIAEFREAIRIQKDSSEAHTDLGVALKAKGRTDEALAEFREAIRLQKDYALAHYNLGYVLYAKSRLDEAIAEFREAIRLKKDFSEAHTNLGLALKAKGRTDEALAEYREALRINKNDVYARNNFRQTVEEAGDQLRRKGDLVGALAMVGKGHAVMPDDGALSNYLAWMLVVCPDPKLRDPKRAVELAGKAVGAAPDDWRFALGLGVAQHFAGEDRAAMKALTRSMELRHGEDAYHYFPLAAACQQLGNREEARKWYDKGVAWMAANKHPYAAELAFFRADAEARLGLGKPPAPEKASPEKRK
jgi:tetratricopeptide (TPR) repeat protein